ncbi:hypothetical protein CC86DRAFT_409496 [Ophiobolus disseminans]|uniref:Uncharacterized protein n=1 Tax=Ophiobolus disseminans TaxID=1469910 RepID=A0A6A6ZR98_9PLEO|nr:hypothetical protein CC86DRAFT_409496 [Ophiobolus disseminans]
MLRKAPNTLTAGLRAVPKPQPAPTLKLGSAKTKRLTRSSPLDDLSPFDNTPQHPLQDTPSEEAPYMTTYTAFDPGMTRPLLMSSLTTGVEGINLPDLFPAAARKAKDSITRDFSPQLEDVKPWPYRLPSFLRP